MKLQLPFKLFNWQLSLDLSQILFDFAFQPQDVTESYHSLESSLLRKND